jgi:hypothetical protein
MSELFPELPPNAFGRIDETDDLDFYAPPRLVTHIDEGATAALTDFYAQTLPPNAVILDLMSSWVSHLPPTLPTAELIGHGMNAEELSANPRLDRWFVQDLNTDPILPLETGSLDGVLCCVGVQYLCRPVDVFAEVRRVLRPGAPVIVSFSNRCFPTKAVAVWRRLNGDGHARLVSHYLERAGFADMGIEVLADGRSSDPLTVVIGRP